MTTTKSPVVFKLGNNIPNFKFFIAPRDHNESASKAGRNYLIQNNDSNFLLTNRSTNDSPPKTTTANNNESQPADGNFFLSLIHFYLS